MLRDVLPTGLAYSGSNGISDGTAVTWTFGLIAAGGGTASGWFSGIPPCATGPITNADYRVVSSDQRVTSPPGAPVVLNVLAPTIGLAWRATRRWLSSARRCSSPPRRARTARR